MFKKILDKIGIVFFSIVVIAIALFSLFLGLGSVAEVIVKIFTIGGGGLLIWAIVLWCTATKN